MSSIEQDIHLKSELNRDGCHGDQEMDVTNSPTNVWNFFDHQKGRSHATCFLCRSDVSFDNVDAVAVLTRHIEDFHPDHYKSEFNSEVSSVGQLRKMFCQSEILSNAICQAWETKLFCDVDVMCGQDSGVVRAHRVVLASLSPFLHSVLKESDGFSFEDFCIIAPDVSSNDLNAFLERVVNGDTSIASVHPSLEFLGFNEKPIRSDGFFVKPEPMVINDDEGSFDSHINDQLENENLSKLKRKKRSFVWRYFERVENFRARCKICQTFVKTDQGNTSGLAAHLRTVHSDLQLPVKVSKYTKEKTSSNAKGGVGKSKRKKRSAVWNHFEEQDNNIAICLTCSATVRTEMGNTTGMSNHLKTNHPDVYQEMQERRLSLDVTETEALVDLKKEIDDSIIESSPVWEFFEHLEDRPDRVKCTECDKVLHGDRNSNELLIRHIVQNHMKVYDWNLKDKLESGSLPQIKDLFHPAWKFFVRIDGENSCRCKDCQMELEFSESDITNLELHLNDHHSKDFIDYQTICSDLRQCRLDEATMAAQTTKPFRAGRRTPRSAIWNYFEKTEDKTKNICMTCGKVLVCNQQNTTNMIRHLECNHHELFVQFLKHSGAPEDSLKEVLDEKPRRRRGPKPTYSDDPVHRTCVDCQKVFSCRPAMLYHRKTVHSGVRPYKCDECGMTFSRPDSFRGHTHSKIRSYLCSHCGKTFARKNIRDQHERAHRGDKRYSCGFCNKMFMTNQQRSNHERTHTGEKPFQCNECGRQFAQQHQLTTHMRIHTGEKPYSCSHCGQKFRHLSSRNNHKCETRPGLGTVGRWNDAQQLVQTSTEHLINSE